MIAIRRRQQPLLHFRDVTNDLFLILTPLFALPHVPAVFSQLLFVFFSLSDIFLLRSIRLRKNLIC